MRILHLIYDSINNPWVGGGGAVRVKKIYSEMVLKGYDVTVLCGNHPQSSSNLYWDKLKYRFIGLKYNYPISIFSYALFSQFFLKKHIEKFDLIIEDFAPWNPLFTYRFQNKKPVVLQIHHKSGLNIIKKYYLGGIIFYLIEKTYCKRFHNIISISKQTAKKFKIEDKAVIIPNGIDKKLIKFKTLLGNYLLYIGRIELYDKGLDILLKALPEDIPLVIIGKGKDQDKLLKRISTRKNIVFKGFVSEKEKIDLILNSKFLVLPSRIEGQGIVCLEAAALGKPVVVSDISELAYTADNGFGICFKTGDSEGLKEKIKYLWHKDDLVLKMGTIAKRYADKFTWDKIAARFEDYLLKLYKKAQNKTISYSKSN